MTATSLEFLNTAASVATTLIIAATAIAALIQLRHLRASNQIAGQLALRQVLLDTAFWDAVGRLRFEIPPLLTDADFRNYVAEFHVAATTRDDERFESVYTAALVVGRNLENIGNMIRNGLTDGRIFLELYASLVVMAWDACEPLLRIRREAVGSDAVWEDFEYLAVLARRRISEHPSCYPRGMERILPPVGSQTT